MSPFEGLAVPHARAVRRLARMLHTAPQGLLAFAMGRSERLRRRAIDALGATLADGFVVNEVVLDATVEAPWLTLAEASRGGGDHTVVVVARIAIADPERETAMLHTLNLGRETRVSEHMRLVVWLDSFDAAAKVSASAPDLWSYRAGVYAFLSREDFDVGEVAPEGGVEDLSARVEELRARFENPTALRGWTKDGTDLALLLIDMNLLEEAAHVVRDLRERNATTLSRDVRSNISLREAWILSRTGQMAALLNAARDLDAQGERERDPVARHAAAEALREAAHKLERWEEALTAAEFAESVQARFRSWDPSLAGGLGPTLVNRSELWLELGDLVGAELDVRRSYIAVAELGPGTEWHERIASEADLLLGRVAWRRARPIEALTLAHHSLVRRVGMKLLDLVRDTVSNIVPWFVALGLTDDAAELARSTLPRGDAPADALLCARLEALLADVYRAPSPARAAGHLADAIASVTRHLDALVDPFLRIEALLSRTEWQRGRASLAPTSAVGALDAALADLDAAEALATQHASPDHLQRIDASRGECHLTAKRHDDARASFESSLARCEGTYGASRLATLHQAIARVETDRGQHARALEALDDAARALGTEPVIPRGARQRLAVARHDALVTLGRRSEARSCLEDSLRLATDAGDQLDAMELHQKLADDDALDRTERMRHARSSLRIAEEALRPLDEAKARVSLVELNGRTDPATTAQLREAWWIVDALGDATSRQRIAALGRSLGVTPEPPSPRRDVTEDA